MVTPSLSLKAARPHQIAASHPLGLATQPHPPRIDFSKSRCTAPQFQWRSPPQRGYSQNSISGDGGVEKYEVSCFPKRVSVDLGTQKCSCRVWQLTGMPSHNLLVPSYRLFHPLLL
ncbi:hypothetical protein RJT34_32182 [Clitoria ternatea]|uniref:Uncharacterized protein n=1 Tax=Clitoria ternatea TaxID=43366 RepID=A0AAN9F3F8_CLITE